MSALCEHYLSFQGIQEIIIATIWKIQTDNSVVTVSDVDDGTLVAVYTVSGQMVGSAKASSNQAAITTNLRKGEIAIVKIGEKAVKVVMH